MPRGFRRPPVPRAIRMSSPFGSAPRGSRPPLGKSLNGDAMINRSPIGGSTNVSGKQNFKKDGQPFGSFQKAVEDDS